MRLQIYGLLFGGVPCNSFAFMASATHARSYLDPWGRSFSFVYEGNVVCTRFALLALVAICRKCFWMLENPLRTMLEHMPPILWLLQDYLNPLVVRWYWTQNNTSQASIRCPPKSTWVPPIIQSSKNPSVVRLMGSYGHFTFKPQVAYGNPLLGAKAFMMIYVCLFRAKAGHLKHTCYTKQHQQP